MTTFDMLLAAREQRGAGFLPYIDPDRLDKADLAKTAAVCEEQGADAILIGGSFLLSTNFDRMVQEVKQAVDVPVVIFPGDTSQIAPAADAILFLSLISGRNPELLIGQHIKAAPLLKAHGIEPISTGYVLVDSGQQTTTEYISNTRPLPRNKPEIAMAHALAAEYLGMQCVYLDAGSGPAKMVPEEMVLAVSEYTSVPLIVGGGIRDPEAARKRVEMGASFIVIGSVFEDRGWDAGFIGGFADAVHQSRG
ncbi:MAG: geranylgeranylglyceryl/heptaprenylglyceryl phosphate synthase [Candidatus Latescibacteria bacterium]|jgi:phosphoglycerol geranylgeranyltransferase|nr:geranylgeranylglyceryl/heptaprenylglyceryl phosphate synthase [Candidatus Latescibacterota bacterium]MBT4136312.1 geranylgeranylglyceryl/heptaprenylglyceryl phosphate synthase [Candidatus Latescibacterota bacterium]